VAIDSFSLREIWTRRLNILSVNAPLSSFNYIIEPKIFHIINVGANLCVRPGLFKFKNQDLTPVGLLIVSIEKI